MIKLVFFDADGTVWNFKKDGVKRRISDAYVNSDVRILLNIFKNKKIKCKLITYQENSNKSYSKIKIKRWLRNFKLEKFFDEIFIADKKSTKEKIIIEILKYNNFNKNQVLFIGDRYKWDYLAGKSIGIKSLLLDKPENKKFKCKKYSFKEIIKNFKTIS